nr:hypothetical protein [Sulfitobacter brevis]
MAFASSTSAGASVQAFARNYLGPRRCDIIRAEHDTAVAVKFLVDGACVLGATLLCRQIPPQLIFRAFFGVDVAVDGLLADTLLRSELGVYGAHIDSSHQQQIVS